MEYSPKNMSEVLSDNDFKFKKKFGQNFIVDKNVIDNIVSKSLVDKDTLVIEVGPGAGSLTCGLARCAGHVMCYEIDTSLKDILSSNLRDFDNVTVRYCDFLKASVVSDLSCFNFSKVYVVANLPYYITTPIIMKIIEDKIPVDKLVVMVQKEVGDRFKALPGTRDYGSLSVFLSYYFDVSKLMDVSRNVFMPKPNVDSIVIEFNRKNNVYSLKNEDLFFSIVRDSFKQKRKTIRNNLRDYDLSIVSDVLSSHGYDLSVRAEELDISVFIDIANNLTK